MWKKLLYWHDMSTTTAQVYDVRRNNERPVPVCGLHVQKIRRDDTSKHEQVRWKLKWQQWRVDETATGIAYHLSHSDILISVIYLLFYWTSITSSWQRLRAGFINSLASFLQRQNGPSLRNMFSNLTKQPTSDSLSKPRIGLGKWGAWMACKHLEMAYS